MNRGGWKRYALIASVVVATMAAFAVLYGWLPWRMDGTRLRGLSPKDQAGVLGSDRGDVLKMFAGLGALVALVYTALKHSLDRRAHELDRRAHALSEQGQVTDRYTKANTQLASDKASERIGGIYALERIMADSERDHTTVVEVLAAFVRQHAPLPAAFGREAKARGGDGLDVLGPIAPPRPAADVQAAMTVLARRPERDEPFALDLRRTKLAGLELSKGARLVGANFDGTDLTGAKLSGASLTEANLTEATLTGADLTEATLIRAEFTEATLTRANLTRATLTKAFLYEVTLTRADLTEATLIDAELSSANLTEAFLTGAKLTGAFLSDAKLTGAALGGATLTGVNGLEASQLADAVLAHSTKLDDSLAHDAWVRARIQACEVVRGIGRAPARTDEPATSTP